MTKKAFDQIAAGLTEALAVARGEAAPAKLHIPAEINVRVAVVTERPEPPKPKDGERLCNCGQYPAWYCEIWPRCVRL